jgi:hypothetical protein
MKYLFLLLFLYGCESPLLSHDRVGDSLDAIDLFFAKENLFAQVNWKSKTAFELSFSPSSDGFSKSIYYAPENHVYVCLWMGIHGHGSVPVTLTELEPGRYRVSDIEFIMLGPWEVRIFLFNQPAADDSCDVEIDGLNPDIIVELQEVKIDV